MAQILVVEDRPTIGMVFNLALSQEGHQVEVLHDGKAGLKRLQENPAPELLIIDLHMPGVSGKEVVETMHASSTLKHIPIIIISGSMPSEDVMPPQGSYEKFISKPFDLFEVIETVQELTEKKENACA